MAKAEGSRAEGSNADSSWQQRAVDRSLSAARERAVSRSGQILAAAQELMLETGGIDFTVQDIVDRSGLSLRSFYKHFGGKDELLLALFEEVMADFADLLREELAEHDDPVDQLRAFVDGFYGRAQLSGEYGGQALGTYHVRMLAVRKDEFAGALAPVIAVLREVVQAGVAAGSFRDDLDVEQLTGLLILTLSTSSQMSVLEVHLTESTLTTDALWAWVASAVAPRTGTGAASGRPGRASRTAGASRAAASRTAKRPASQQRSAG